MKGITVTELTFEDQLAHDEVFVEYFNAFLALPAFPKVVQYDPMSGSFQEIKKEQKLLPLQPSENAEFEAKQRERVMEWVKKERLPLFLKTLLYLKFKLCRLLLRKLKDFRSTARDSSRGLRGYSRATTSSVYSQQVNRPVSNVSNRSWPGIPVRHFGRRPLGSATSLPGMLRLALKDSSNENNEAEIVEPDRLEDGVHNISLTDGKTEAGPQIVNEKAGKEDEQTREDKNQVRDNDNGSDVESVFGPEEEIQAVMEFDEQDDAQTEADARSIASKHNITLQELKEQVLGSLQGMTLLRAFLEDTVGIHLYNFWLDVEQYKDSLQYEPEESIREHRNRLFREIVDKYKNYLTPDAKEQIDRALFHGGVTQDLFTRTQYDMLRRLRSYWVPRFLVHLERNEDYRDDYFAHVNPRDQYRPNSSLNFIPSLSLVHSIPPLGDWCREMIRCHKWDRDILIKDKRRDSANHRLNFMEGGDVDPFMSALKAEKDAGYPFKRYLQGVDNSMLALICFWLDVKEFYAAEKRSGDRYLSRCNAWNIFNTYLAPGTEFNIGIDKTERKQIEKILHSTEELPVNLFEVVQNFILGALRISWEDFKDYDLQRYRKHPKRKSERIPSPSLVSHEGKSNEGHYYSPTTGRWVRRHPGSSPSERGRRLYTSIAISEEIDATRSSSSSPKRSFIPPPPSPSKKSKNNKNRKKSKTNKNVIRRKKKTTKTATTSEDEDSDSTDERPEKTAPPVEPDFVDVVENKGTMAAFKQYVQNMEGRQAFNQLVMYLEIEQYLGILAAKKTQKAQQASHIYKTFFDPSSRRSVSLPSIMLNKVEAERPTTPMLLEAQEFVKTDVEMCFKSFFKNSQESMSIKRNGDGTGTNTPNQGSKADGMDTQHSFLQVYKRRAHKKTKNAGRAQPNKEDREDFKRTLQATHGRLSMKLEMFRRHLQNHGDSDSFPKLENNLLFYLEVQKFKDLFNYMDDGSLNRKVETIIECFLDSATPPWLQIDIGSDLAARIIHKAQTFSTARKASRESKDPGLFDEAQAILFKELLPYWAGFCRNYKPPEDEGGFKLPPTKQEKTHQRRFNEFVKFQAMTETLVLPPVTPTIGQSRSEATFSFSDGMRWKDRREVETASVRSSAQGSVAESIAGGHRKSSATSSSIHQIEVGS